MSERSSFNSAIFLSPAIMYKDNCLKYSKFFSYIASNIAISFNICNLCFSNSFSILSIFTSIFPYLAIILSNSFFAFSEISFKLGEV